MENESRPGRGLVIFAVVLFITAFLISILAAVGTFELTNDPEMKHFYDWVRVGSIHLMIASVASAVVGIGLYLTRREVK